MDQEPSDFQELKIPRLRSTFTYGCVMKTRPLSTGEGITAIKLKLTPK